MITSENFKKALDIGFTFQRVYKPKGQPKVVLSPTTVNGKAHQLRCSTCSSDATPVYHNITRFQAYTIELNNQIIQPYSSCASQVGADDDRSIRIDMKLICLWCHRSLDITFVDEDDIRFCDRECFEAYRVNIQKVSTFLPYSSNALLSRNWINGWVSSLLLKGTIANLIEIKKCC